MKLRAISGLEFLCYENQEKDIKVRDLIDDSAMFDRESREYLHQVIDLLETNDLLLENLLYLSDVLDSISRLSLNKDVDITTISLNMTNEDKMVAIDKCLTLMKECKKRWGICDVLNRNHFGEENSRIIDMTDVEYIFLSVLIAYEIHYRKETEPVEGIFLFEDFRKEPRIEWLRKVKDYYNKGEEYIRGK